MSEQWKPVVGYEDRYEISDHGRLRSLRRSRSGGPGHHLSIQTIFGYSRALLFKDKKKKMAFVHRLVWEAFRSPIPRGFIVNHVNHVDHNKGNPKLENLELITQQENLQKACVHHGGHPSTRLKQRRKKS